jgi:hypothetical protein
MRVTLRAAIVVAACTLLWSAPLGAHHGSASFDDKEITLKGKVSEWLWANPHCFLKIEAADATGTVRNWNLEMGNPTDMSVRGFRRNTFKPGDEVTVTLQPVKSGQPVGRIRTVTLADGTKL